MSVLAFDPTAILFKDGQTVYVEAALHRLEDENLQLVLIDANGMEVLRVELRPDFLEFAASVEKPDPPFVPSWLRSRMGVA